MKFITALILALVSVSSYANTSVVTYIGHSFVPSVSDDKGQSVGAGLRVFRNNGSSIEVGYLLEMYEKYDGTRRGAYVLLSPKSFSYRSLDVSFGVGPYINNTLIFAEGHNLPHEPSEIATKGTRVAALFKVEMEYNFTKRFSTGVSGWHTEFTDRRLNGNVLLFSSRYSF